MCIAAPASPGKKERAAGKAAGAAPGRFAVPAGPKLVIDNR
jgi:hypothetical protein